MICYNYATKNPSNMRGYRWIESQKICIKYLEHTKCTFPPPYSICNQFFIQSWLNSKEIMHGLGVETIEEKFK